MTELVERIGGGAYETRAADCGLDAQRGDELGKLARGVDSMAVKIDEAMREAAIKAMMVENAPINIMAADRDFKITYLNPASKKTFKQVESLLPCKADAVLGQSIDIFHKNPSQQRSILADPKKLPHEAQIKIGNETAELTASAVYDNKGQYLGPMVTWSLVTDKIAAQQKQRELQQEAEQRANELQTKVDALAEDRARGGGGRPLHQGHSQGK